MSYQGPLLDGGPYGIAQGFGCTCQLTVEWTCGGCGCAGGYHAGIDIAAPQGTAVHALGPGTVFQIGFCTYGGCGDTCSGGGVNAVGVRGSGLDFRYYHLVDHVVNVGDNVVSGQVLGHVGSMGCSFGAHLHYQVNHAGDSNGCNALDPGQYLQTWPTPFPAWTIAAARTAVTLAYWDMLCVSSPDSAGFDFWVNQLVNGLDTEAHVRASLLAQGTSLCHHTPPPPPGPPASGSPMLAIGVVLGVGALGLWEFNRSPELRRRIHRLGHSLGPHHHQRPLRRSERIVP